MTGHWKPDRLQMFATSLAMMAFAICTQFQVVSTYSFGFISIRHRFGPGA